MVMSFEEAAGSQYDYRPSDHETLRTIGTITLAPHVGPTAVGKNYLMAHLVDILGYHQVGNMTTRELRPNDPKNIRSIHQNDMLSAIEKGSLVQYAAHLGSRALYATSIEDYQAGRVNVKDIYAHTIDAFAEYGFRHVRPVCLLVSPEEWETRLDARFMTATREQRAARLEEAAESIEWILDGSPSIRRVMVISDDVNTQENVERIRSFVEQGTTVEPERVHLDTAERMLQAIPTLHMKYTKEN